MPYIKRDENGKIKGLSLTPTEGWEEVPYQDYIRYQQELKEYEQNYEIYFRKAPSWKIEREKAYGEPKKQLEFITENGLDAWVNKVNQVKQDIPKTPLPQEQKQWLEDNGLLEEYANYHNVDINDL